jgi:hypothetical protein
MAAAVEPGEPSGHRPWRDGDGACGERGHRCAACCVRGERAEEEELPSEVVDAEWGSAGDDAGVSDGCGGGVAACTAGYKLFAAVWVREGGFYSLR